MDLKLTDAVGPDGKPIIDVMVQNGDLALVTDIDAIVQGLAMMLRTFLLESVYDRNAGLPYVQVFFDPNTTIDAIVFTIEKRIRDFPGITGVQEITPEIDHATRTCRITGSVIALGQTVPLPPIEVSA